MYSFSPRCSSLPDCHVTLSRVPSTIGLCWLSIFKTFWIRGKLLYNVVLVSVVQSMSQPYVYLCLFPSESPSHYSPYSTTLGCHRAHGWAPWIIQQLPTSYLFTYSNVYALMLLSQYVPPSPSPAVSATLFSYVCMSIPIL